MDVKIEEISSKINREDNKSTESKTCRAAWQVKMTTLHYSYDAFHITNYCQIYIHHSFHLNWLDHCFRYLWHVWPVFTPLDHLQQSSARSLQNLKKNQVPFIWRWKRKHGLVSRKRIIFIQQWIVIIKITTVRLYQSHSFWFIF